MLTIQRHHDICCGHRVVGQGGMCEHLHGHNYRIHFFVRRSYYDRDGVGRVLDFSNLKRGLCQWLEDHWDHRFLVWELDEHLTALKKIDPTVAIVNFNPTAENMAEYLVRTVGPRLLQPVGCVLISCRIDETRKCSATYSLDQETKK